jgi:hypothetical protein
MVFEPGILLTMADYKEPLGLLGLLAEALLVPQVI